MNKQAKPMLVKSTPSGSFSAKHKKNVYNAVSSAAHKEAEEIMSGKKKTKTYCSAEEFLADLKA